MRQPAFWLAALCAYLLMPAPWPRRRTRRFGLLNAAALAALLGWRDLLAAAALTLTAYGLLHAHATKPPGPHISSAVRRFGPGLLLVLTGTLFVAHKLAHGAPAASDGPWPQAGLALLSRLAYSYAGLRLWDCARAVARGAALLDPLALLGYLFPFHMLPAGPIGSYAEHVQADVQPVADPPPGRAGFAAEFDRLSAGVDRVVQGLVYKFVLAESLRLFAFGLQAPLRPASLADSALLVLYLFFDFAGYSLVALGLGRLMGVPTPVNFDRPFLATSLTEFWQRWHVSLGRFVRTHLFLPLQLGGVRAWGVPRAHLVGFAVLVLSFGWVGLWHRFAWGFVLWGLGMGAALALEKLLRDHWWARRTWAARPATQRAVRWLGPLYVFAALVLSLHPLLRAGLVW